MLGGINAPITGSTELLASTVSARWCRSHARAVKASPVEFAKWQAIAKPARSLAHKL